MASHDPNILIVDDSAMTRRMIRRVIDMAEIHVGRISEAPDGQAALAVMVAERIDLVLADLNMPVMDGFEMIRHMRQSEALKHIPIIVISAQPDTDQIEHLKSQGVANYLPKPFTPEAVRDLIGPLLKRVQAAEELPPQHSDAAFNLNLAEALSEALETMAFISPEMQEDSEEPVEARVVSVAFHGAGGNGCLTLAAPRKFGEMVAANCDADPSAADADDALKELANVTCGLLLRKRVGGAAGFEMSPPVVGSEQDAVLDGDVVRFKAEGHAIVARVTSDWDSCAHKEEK